VMKTVQTVSRQNATGQPKANLNPNIWPRPNVIADHLDSKENTQLWSVEYFARQPRRTVVA